MVIVNSIVTVIIIIINITKEQILKFTISKFVFPVLSAADIDRLPVVAALSSP